MKALSIRQPWATFIANGEKTIECRSWQTPYRGEILVCASGRKMVCDDGLVFPAGVALCVIELIGIHRMKKSDLAAACMQDFQPEELVDVMKGFAWEIRLKYPIIPFPVKGKLHIFEVDAEPQPLPSTYADHLDYLCKSQGIG